jgi:predicted phosphoribosyltransferase
VAEAIDSSREIAAAKVPLSTYEELKREVRGVICRLMPESFFGISLCFERFPRTSGEEVGDLLERAARAVGSSHEMDLVKCRKAVLDLPDDRS